MHVPFCAARCPYCDYPVVVGNLELAGRLVGAMLAEVHALRAAMPARPVAALYVGGGTPSLLPRPELRRLLTGLAGALVADGAGGRAPEWTLEANPEDLDEELLQVCRAAGVNRLSVGVQTFEEPLLRRLGRRCDARTLTARLELLARHWHGRLNVDLLAGVPGQRTAAVTGAVDRLAAMGIDHVTLLQLEDPPPGGPVPAAAADALWLAGGARLRRHGYRQYEVTHFGRRGRPLAVPASCIAAAAGGRCRAGGRRHPARGRRSCPSTGRRPPRPPAPCTLRTPRKFRRISPPAGGAGVPP